MTIILPEGAKGDWDAIARDYAAGILTVEAICAAYSIAGSTLYRYLRKSGWPLRREMSSNARTADSGASGAIERTVPKAVPVSDAHTQKNSNAKHRPTPDLTSRLLSALDYKMTEFENRMAENVSSGKANAADSERDARTLNTLVRLFEKLNGFGEKATETEKAARPASNSKSGNASGTTAASSADSSVKDAHDADHLRNDLAQRLERLRGQIGG